VSLIHSVDQIDLLKEINKEAAKNNRVIECLIQVYIATEESKHGFSFDEAESLFKSDFRMLFPHVKIKGLMGMASFTSDVQQVKKEFLSLKDFKAMRQAAHLEFASRVVALATAVVVLWRRRGNSNVEKRRVGGWSCDAQRRGFVVRLLPE
jgi:uncharacterized pyridoxal phosphate-containing UPF0001 family protein